MTFLGLQLTAGLSSAIAVSVLAVLWNYSSLPGVRWSEITAGVMSFLAAAGLEVLVGGNALGMFTSMAWISQIAGILNVIGGLLLLVGGVINAVQLLQRQYA